MRDEVNRWLAETESLFDFRNALVHSTGGFETRGDGRQQFVRERTREGRTLDQFTVSEVNDVVDRIGDATHDGARLVIDASFLASHGPAAFDQLVAERERRRAEWEALVEEIRSSPADCEPMAKGDTTGGSGQGPSGPGLMSDGAGPSLGRQTSHQR